MKEADKNPELKVEPWSEDREMTPEEISEALKIHKEAAEMEKSVRDKFNRENPDWVDYHQNNHT